MSTKVSSETQTTSQATPTEAEKQMQELQLGQYKQTVGPQTELQLQGMDLVKQMFAGSTELPGFFGAMGQGISPQAIGQQASELGRQAMPGFQQLGLADSGVAMREISRDIANQILFPAEQFNLGAKQNLLNLALGGQAQVQQPVLGGQQILSNQLQGLRSYSGTQSTTQRQNPFLQSFYSSMGSGLGNFFNPQTYIKPCWIAAELFGGWFVPKTCRVRYYVRNIGPKWLLNLYMKYGERIAKFIHNKPIFKVMLRPLFEYFALRGGV